jgi:hypothetical protein
MFPRNIGFLLNGRKVAGSIPDVTGISIDLILPAALWPWGGLGL